MYNNLIAIQAVKHMTDADMGKVIGVSRQTYKAKLKLCTFSVEECRAFCAYFNRPFNWLFAKDTELGLE